MYRNRDCEASLSRRRSVIIMLCVGWVAAGLWYNILGPDKGVCAVRAFCAVRAGGARGVVSPRRAGARAPPVLLPA